MPQVQVEQETQNIELLGYYVDKSVDKLVLEMRLLNLPDAGDNIVSVGFKRHFLKWMLKELDRWEDKVEEGEKE